MLYLRNCWQHAQLKKIRPKLPIPRAAMVNATAQATAKLYCASRQRPVKYLGVIIISQTFTSRWFSNVLKHKPGVIFLFFHWRCCFVDYPLENLSLPLARWLIDSRWPYNEIIRGGLLMTTLSIFAGQVSKEMDIKLFTFQRITMTDYYQPFNYIWHSFAEFMGRVALWPYFFYVSSQVVP